MSQASKGARQFQALFDTIPFKGTVTLTATAGSETQDDIAVIGATPGSIVLWGLAEDMEGGVISANVNAADVVEFTLTNATGSTITIADAVITGCVLVPKGVFGSLTNT